MNTSTPLEQAFHLQMQTLATTLQPSTIRYYQSCLNRFLHYLRLAYPDVRRPEQLRRCPHILGWLHSLTQETPPLNNRTRQACLLCLRRLFDDLISNGYLLPEDLLVRQDFPPRNLYLPQPLSPENDRLLDQELRRTDDLCSNALRLLRGTGMRIGECLRLPTDCLRDLGREQWAIHVPLGKLHTERWVPLDDDLRRIVARILSLRVGPPPGMSSAATDWLLTQPNGRRVTYNILREVLQKTSRRAGCSISIRPHQLRHTYASELLRAGISLPVLKQLLGHKDIRMTMVYVQVTQNDLQRQYHLARKNMAETHTLPQLPTLLAAEPGGLQTVSQSLVTARHLLEMYRRQLDHKQSRRKIARLINRVTKVLAELAHLDTPEK